MLTMGWWWYNSRLLGIFAAHSMIGARPFTTLLASRLGLDPSLNRFHAPLVYHEDYSFAGWPENHTFPVRTTVFFFFCASHHFEDEQVCSQRTRLVNN